MTLTWSQCFAFGCTRSKESRFLMCPQHWRMVSPVTGMEVYATCRAWQKGGKIGPYLLAREKAKLEVAVECEYTAEILDSIRAEIARLEKVDG